MKRFLQTSFLLLFGITVPFICLAEENSTSDFGKNEQLTTEFSIYDDNAFAVTTQPDGKVVVAGHSENGVDTDIAVARYLSDGKLDKDFNHNGQVTVAVGSGNDSGLALIVQQDGKILVAGTTDNGDDLDVAVIRLQSDGLPDMDFDQDGQVIITLSDSDDRAQSVLLQKDGKIILAGSSEDKESTHLFLARLNSNGSLDETFGTNGFANSVDAQNSAALSAALQFDGRILLAGFSGTKEHKRATIFSFLENGTLDKTFADQGIAPSGPEDDDSLFYDLKIYEDETIVAAGATIGEDYRSVLLAKFTVNGTADPEFNGEGLVQTDLGVDTVAYGLAIAHDGSIYLAGSGSKNQDTDFILLHFNSAGYPLQSEPTVIVEEEEEEEETTIVLNELELRESNQPETNYTLTDFASYNDVARAIQILDDGTILVAGSADNGKDTDFALLYYSPEVLADIRQQGGIYTPQGKYISTTLPTMVTRNSAASGGYLRQYTSSPSSVVTERGVCYGITPAPGVKIPSDPSPEYQTETNPKEEEEEIEFNPFKTSTVLEGCTSDGAGDGEFRSDLLGLTPDTTYYIRAYAILETDIIIYGNELRFTTEDACFIATAAHGSIDKSQVIILRQFRDTFLKSSIPGKLLIQTYYRFSPPLAELISDHSSLQQITRIFLTPITTMSYFMLHPLVTLQLTAILFFVAILLLLAIVSQKRQRIANSASGFTLIELLVVLVIIGILAGYVGPRIMGHPEEAKRTMAAAQISSLETALETYRLDNGTYPSTEQGLQALVEAPSVGKLPPKWRTGGYMKKGKVPKDPWANEYVYLSPGTHSDFDISSYGADHESGGEDGDADINNWELE